MSKPLTLALLKLTARAGRKSQSHRQRADAQAGMEILENARPIIAPSACRQTQSAWPWWG